MPDFTFTSPEGKSYTVSGPDGATREQAFAILQSQMGQSPAAPKPTGWADVPGQALANLPKSAGNFVGGIYQAVRHPLDTGMNALDIAAGALHNALPTSVADFIDAHDPTPNAAANTARAVRAADATGQFLKDRYGSEAGVKNTLSTDPVGVASDVATVLTGGGTLAAKLPMLGRVGRVAQVAGEAVNPVNVAKVAAVKALPKIGDAAAAVVGNLGTHTGAESIKTAYQAGQQGGKAAQTLADNMRGNANMTDVLATAKANLQAMGQQKAQAYRNGMAAISNDKTVLDFAPIDQAVAEADKIGKYGDQVINPKAAQVHADIQAAIDNWKNLPPEQFHTPEGFDALKRQIGGIVDSIPYEEKTAHLVGGNIYNAVKDSIVKQAPTYADTMKAYSDATEQIREIERALSLGNKASADTAMRKLQSLTRNNVNTNYGNRLRLAQQLEQQGGEALMPALAGQALSSWTPRGIGGATAGLSGLAGYSLGGLHTALPLLAVQSPRLMGEAALAAGKGAAKVKSAAQLPMRAWNATGLDFPDTANYLYQLGRLPQR